MIKERTLEILEELTGNGKFTSVAFKEPLTREEINKLLEINITEDQWNDSNLHYVDASCERDNYILLIALEDLTNDEMVLDEMHNTGIDLELAIEDNKVTDIYSYCEY